MAKRDKSDFVGWATEYLTHHGHEPGESEDLESFEVDVAIDEFGEAYKVMLSEINPNLTVNTDTFSRSTEPGYLTRYRMLRNRIFDGLLYKAIKESDFTLLLATIQEYKDPVLAQRFLDEYNRSNTQLRGGVAGNKVRMEKTINNRNKRSAEMRLALKSYAKRKRNIERRGGRYYRTGPVGSVAVGLVLKTNIGLNAYLKKKIIGPVTRVSGADPIEVQLAQRAKHAIPLEIE